MKIYPLSVLKTYAPAGWEWYEMSWLIIVKKGVFWFDTVNLIHKLRKVIFMAIYTWQCKHWTKQSQISTLWLKGAPVSIKDLVERCFMWLYCTFVLPAVDITSESGQWWTQGWMDSWLCVHCGRNVGSWICLILEPTVPLKWRYLLACFEPSHMCLDHVLY